MYTAQGMLLCDNDKATTTKPEAREGFFAKHNMDKAQAPLHTAEEGFWQESTMGTLGKLRSSSAQGNRNAEAPADAAKSLERFFSSPMLKKAEDIMGSGKETFCGGSTCGLSAM